MAVALWPSDLYLQIPQLLLDRFEHLDVEVEVNLLKHVHPAVGVRDGVTEGCELPIVVQYLHLHLPPLLQNLLDILFRVVVGFSEPQQDGVVVWVVTVSLTIVPKQHLLESKSSPNKGDEQNSAASN